MFSLVTLTMASLVRGRALTLLEALVGQASVSASRNISQNATVLGQKNGLGTVARVSEARDSAAPATHKTVSWCLALMMLLNDALKLSVRDMVVVVHVGARCIRPVFLDTSA